MLDEERKDVKVFGMKPSHFIVSSVISGSIAALTFEIVKKITSNERLQKDIDERNSYDSNILRRFIERRNKRSDLVTPNTTYKSKSGLPPKDFRDKTV